MTFFIIGIIDLLAGIILTFSPSIVLMGVTKYFGYALLVKGIWSIISDLVYLMSRK